MTALPHTDACEICQSIRRYTGRAYSHRRRRQRPTPTPALAPPLTPTPAPQPDITIERHPGGGWYWTCWRGDDVCADGAPTPWRGWAQEWGAYFAAGLHLTQDHEGLGTR